LNDDDKDGVPNYLDQEANSPEGATVNSRGVVDPTTTDTDKDGIADAYDMCPDADGDGVADKDDKCPAVAGSIWNNGCPGGSGGDNVISVNPPIENLYFSIASATLSRNETAKLDKVVDLMKANPSYKLIVKGHTDNMGAFDYNQSLSENRAIAAKNYLLKKGVDPMRVRTVAYGFNQPVGKENTLTGRAQNRRVEFEVRN
jgi:OOP family OmpA-OmpF porin|tara:strand:+ start:5212 stop:5814 length:603 start_codon:yes stop_codon:yes gene_type:complete